MLKKERLIELDKEDLIRIIEENEKEIEKLKGTMELFIKHSIILENQFPKDPLNDKIQFYDQQWCYVEKLVYILKLAKRPLQSSEILEWLLKHDENVKYCWGNKVKSLSVYLNKAVRYRRILSRKVPGNNGYYYFLPEEAPETGNI